MADNKGEPAAPRSIRLSSLRSRLPLRPLLKKPCKWPSAAALKVSWRTRDLANCSALEKPGANGQPAGKVLDPQALTGRADAKTGPLRGWTLQDSAISMISWPAPVRSLRRPRPSSCRPIYCSITIRSRFALRPLLVSKNWNPLSRRNPQATFLIEGHSDSFGSDDYNLALSERRAETVKTWLVTVMKISPERIEAIGFGESQLITSASGTIEEQQINRRVEIVIGPNCWRCHPDAEPEQLATKAWPFFSKRAEFAVQLRHGQSIVHRDR